MTRLGIAAVTAATLLLAGPARADKPEIVFKGALSITKTEGCAPGWDPLNMFYQGFYWAPIAGSVNGPDTILSFHSTSSGAHGFRLNGGSFTSSYQAVNAYFVQTRAGLYYPFVKITRQTPAVLTTTTQQITLVGAVKGFDFRPTCTLYFTMAGLRDNH